MFCTGCGKALADGSKFCTNCGKAVAVKKPDAQNTQINNINEDTDAISAGELVFGEDASVDELVFGEDVSEDTELVFGEDAYAEEISQEAEAPVYEQEIVIEAESATVEEPVYEETVVTEGASVIEETFAPQEEPIIEAEPTSEENSVDEQASVIEEAPVIPKEEFVATENASSYEEPESQEEVAPERVPVLERRPVIERTPVIPQNPAINNGQFAPNQQFNQMPQGQNFQQQPVYNNSMPAPRKKGGKIVVIAVVAVVLVVLGVIGISFLNKDKSEEPLQEMPQDTVAANYEETSLYAENTETTEAQVTETTTEAVETTAKETKPAIPQYTEHDADKLFTWLMDEYSSAISAQVFFVTEKNFKSLALEWFMPRNKTYQFYNNGVQYDSVVETRENGKSLKISDMMTESEFQSLLLSTGGTFDAFSVEDIQAELDSVWKKGRFKATDLDMGSFNTRYITSKGYLVMPIEPTGEYGSYKAVYTSFSQKGNIYTLKGYMIEITDATNYDVYDASTNCFLGRSMSSSESYSASFDAVLYEINRSSEDLMPVYFIFEGTENGLRFKGLKLHRTVPDATGDYGTGIVKAQGGLNVRVSPSTDAMLVTTIPDGAQVYITGKSATATDWVYVIYFLEDSFRSYSGWVNKKFIQ